MTKVASRKQKARLLQQKVRDKLLKILKPYGVLPDDVKSTPMGVSGADVQLSPFAKCLISVSVECKSLARVGVYKYWEQCVSNTPKDTQPLVVIKGNHKKPLALIDLDYYMQLEQARIERDNK